jgi:hypothetical protein
LFEAPWIPGDQVTGPKYHRIAPVPDIPAVVTIVEAGAGDYLGRFAGMHFVGYPHTQGITEVEHVLKWPIGTPPVAHADTHEGHAESIAHGVEWWNMLNPANGGAELTHTAEEAEAAFPRVRYELSKRPRAEREFIVMMLWRDGLPEGPFPVID